LFCARTVRCARSCFELATAEGICPCCPPPPLHFRYSTVVISAEDRVARLEACRALLPLEAVLDAQEQAAAVEAEPVAQQEAVAAVAEPVAQQEAVVVAAEPVAQQQAAVVVARSGVRRPEPSVD
jgi:hypothetical protein